MKAAILDVKPFRPLLPLLGAVTLGAFCVLLVLLSLTGTSVLASPSTAAPVMPERLRPLSGAQAHMANVEVAWKSVGVPTYALQLDRGVRTTMASLVGGLDEGLHSWAVEAVKG